MNEAGRRSARDCPSSAESSTLCSARRCHQKGSQEKAAHSYERCSRELIRSDCHAKLIVHQPAKERHVYKMKKSPAQKVESPSQLIEARIKELGDCRGKTLSRLRALIKQADPEVVEEWKWRKPSHPGVPVWSHQGPICTGESYKSVVKLTFFKGASLKDPSGLFNSSLEGNTRRAIDFHEDDEIDEKAFATLIRAAVSLNESSSR